MGKRGVEFQECMTVFLSILSGLAGVYGLYTGYTSKQIPTVLWVSALFTINYWLCFYRFYNKK
jgi:hypothetical protein